MPHGYYFETAVTRNCMRILQTPLALHLHLNRCRLLERGIFRTQSSSKRWMVDGAHELGSDVCAGLWYPAPAFCVATLTHCCGADYSLALI